MPNHPWIHSWQPKLLGTELVLAQYFCSYTCLWLLMPCFLRLVTLIPCCSPKWLLQSWMGITDKSPQKILSYKHGKIRMWRTALSSLNTGDAQMEIRCKAVGKKWKMSITGVSTKKKIQRAMSKLKFYYQLSMWYLTSVLIGLNVLLSLTEL